MSDDNKSIISRFAEIATLAGIKGSIDDEGERYRATFGFEDGRSQLVLVRAIKTPGGPGVCVFSIAAKYKKGFFGSLSKDAAIELLRLNETTYFARYGIRDMGDETTIVASIDLLIDTLDPEELNSAVRSVSVAADKWEEKAKQGDNF